MTRCEYDRLIELHPSYKEDPMEYLKIHVRDEVLAEKMMEGLRAAGLQNH